MTSARAMYSHRRKMRFFMAVCEDKKSFNRIFCELQFQQYLAIKHAFIIDRLMNNQQNFVLFISAIFEVSLVPSLISPTRAIYSEPCNQSKWMSPGISVTSLFQASPKGISQCFQCQHVLWQRSHLSTFLCENLVLFDIIHGIKSCNLCQSEQQ